MELCYRNVRNSWHRFFSTGYCLKSPQKGDKNIFSNQLKAELVKLSTTWLQDELYNYVHSSKSGFNKSPFNFISQARFGI